MTMGNYGILQTLDPEIHLYIWHIL